MLRGEAMGGGQLLGTVAGEEKAKAGEDAGPEQVASPFAHLEQALTRAGTNELQCSLGCSWIHLTDFGRIIVDLLNQDL